MICNRRDLLRVGSLAGLGRVLGGEPLFGSSPGSASSRAPENVSCILLRLVGGPSQLDTWDLKPQAPVEIRSPYRPIPTNVDGIQISEIFPRMARHADKYALVRSVYHTGPAVHETGFQLLEAGGVFQDSVLLPRRAGRELQLRAEPENVRARYGWNRFGASCLLARQLVEDGVRFVTVNMFGSVFQEATWDIHGSAPFSSLGCYHETVGPMFDAAYSALLEDLHQRGLLGRTLVVATGEFGRTPWINPVGGRDHWPQCWTMLFAGGGVRGGQVVGESDQIGAAPSSRPVTLAEVNATIYRALGLPRDVTMQRLEPGVRPIEELFV